MTCLIWHFIPLQVDITDSLTLVPCRELEKEGFACLRTIVPGLNKRSSCVAVVQETGNYIKQLHEEILARFGKVRTAALSCYVSVVVIAALFVILIKYTLHS